MADEAQRPSADGALAKAVSHMTGVLLSDATLDAMLELVVFLAHRSMPDMRGVSVSLTREGKLITAAYSTKHADVGDQHQYESGAGPCVEAVRTGEVVKSTDLLAEQRWPEFTPVALEEGAYGILSVPLQVNNSTVGGLNIYSAKARDFDEVLNEIETFARYAAVVLANAQTYASAEQLNHELHEALDSREVIGEAKGILMEREKVSGQEAFDMLRRISQKNNVKLRDVAQLFVDSVKQSSSR